MKEFFQQLSDILHFELFHLETQDVGVTVFNIAMPIFIFFLAKWSTKLIQSWVEKRKAGAKNRQNSFLQLIKYAIYIVGIIASIESMGEILHFELFHFDNQKVRITVFNVLMLVTIFIVTRWVIKLARLLLEQRMVDRDMRKGSLNSLLQLIKYFVFVVAITIGLESMGIKLSFLLASSAALLVGIGLGLQQVFHDLVSGIILLFEGTIQVGDVVDLKNVVGRVTEIGLRTSKIKTREDVYVIVPNSKFTSGDVVNWSHIDTATRFDITVGVAYGSDVQKVRSSLMEAAQKHEKIDKEPVPFVRFEDFGESALIFQLFFWTDETFLVEGLKSDLRFDIDAAFREQGITIPFPQRDLHLKTGSFSKE